jgi:hypothetical protein
LAAPDFFFFFFFFLASLDDEDDEEDVDDSEMAVGVDASAQDDADSDEDEDDAAKADVTCDDCDRSAEVAIVVVAGACTARPENRPSDSEAASGATSSSLTVDEFLLRAL